MCQKLLCKVHLHFLTLTIMIPILQMMKSRLKEVEGLVQGHTDILLGDLLPPTIVPIASQMKEQII